MKWRKLILWLKYFVQALRVCCLRNKSYDYILAWNAVTGIFVAMLSRILSLHKPKILLLNLIALQKHPIHNYLRRICYRFSLKRADIVTINSEYLVDKYKNEFEIPVSKIAILTDVVESNSFDYVGSKGTEPYDVFSGGEASRDWDTLIDVAKINPRTSFIVIARRKFFRPNKVPENVIVYFDTPYDFFYDKMKQCKIVVLTLNTLVTSGLIVLTNAMLMGKAVIATRTPATENYIISGKNGILVEMKDVVGLSTAIQALLENLEKARQMGIEARNSILLNHTERQYICNLKKILDSISK
ncbi:MAG: glycosyltransferase [candidate division WOR-3 bacterium]|nr:glycosyltransferase [candidate division WOR-3 bacterium]